MPGPTDKAYTFDHAVSADGSVAFRCSQDVDEWRWLELPAWHPVAMQTINYWVSVECSAARETLDRDKWSALTWMDWKVGDFAAGIPARGEMENAGIDGEVGFAIRLYDTADRLIYSSRGKGVVFRTRDFEGWRKEAKTSLLGKVPHGDFSYADPASLGIGPHEFPLISPVRSDAQPYVDALVTRDNGMPPAARYMSGSGDHVNATHLAECARQFVAALTGNPAVRFPRGEIRFTRYVELGAPFRIELLSREGSVITLSVEQGGKPCTAIKLVAA
ncbi:hypothetical protein P7228_04355 [Altererythrobacter arenosus]|uniref:Uncharacterized protein n=1 Tax=Altererythrobacter arenosus TaxID=3032592 RepID=A0ABY8FWG0_9SPHN|nr:hypothetical protein [Altererythrobacter sp. CAU 1644]WFL78303.1 hypothetical protein P7228_04355 [Altererythrobacter sp. CAU 1644]